MQLHRILALAAVAFMGSVRALDFSDAQADSGDDDRDLNLTPNDEDRIYGGSEADAEKYPFIVSLRKTAEGTTYCGGTLIHPQYIVTAAHCVKNTTYASIGSRYSRGSSEGERILVTETYVHPKYVKDTHRFDVAVMKLEKPSTYKTIGLAKADGSQNKDNSMAVVRGWGMTESNVAAATMLEVNVKIVSNAVCNKSYNNRITAEMLCAGEGGGKDSCQGDSGGPLISNNVLVGIVSWGGACGEAPGVYVRVSNVLDFINEKVGGGATPAASSAAPTSSAPAPSSAVPSVTPSVTPSPMPSSSAPEAVTETPVPSAADASETPVPSAADASETPAPSDETTDDASEAPSASDETTDDSSFNGSTDNGDSVGDDKEDNDSEKVPSPVPSSSPAGKGGKGDVPAPVPASPDAGKGGKGGKGDVPAPVPSSSEAGKGGKGDVPAPVPSSSPAGKGGKGDVPAPVPSSPDAGKGGKGGKGDVPAPVPSSSDAGKGGKGDVPAPVPSAAAGKGGKGDVPAPVPSSPDAGKGGKGGKGDVPAPVPSSSDAGKGGKGDVPTPGSSDIGNGSDVTTPAPKSSKPKKKDCSARL